ncbi:MAG TPA: hypothetical protein VGR43_02555 [Dehalococcoidia bacterium]|jgi:hypothetical protein|nr:hypothetical protein [Dehalococcoidia bacterium]
MTPDCDLIWDFAARFPTPEVREAYGPEDPNIEIQTVAVPHVLLCEAYVEADARGRVQESKLWKLLQQNRDERYHHFPSALIGEEEGATRFEDVYVDFKKLLAIPTTQMYEGIKSGALLRIAWIPPVYRHDLIQRFYSYLARVAVPAD